MIFPTTYRVLSTNTFFADSYAIVPIRYEDRMKIMQWRNEQIYHLRQAKLLTKDDQEDYFTDVVFKLFNQEKPSQILFSYLENGECIGYGGLVHINWIDKNAEISFIINPALEKDGFYKHWKIYLDLLEKVAFEELQLHKIYTYAFDLRPHLYEAVEAVGYVKEAELKEHCYFDGRFISAIIHSKINNSVSIRKAHANDVKITHEWANDEDTRRSSFLSDAIPFDRHEKWWLSKLDNKKTCYFICEVGQQEAGIVRFDASDKDNLYTIGITVSPQFRGRGLSDKFLKRACSAFFQSNNNAIVEAYIKKENVASIKAFERAGFQYKDALTIYSVESVKYELKNHD